MEKNMYVSPRVEMVKMEVSNMMACSVNDHDIIEAYSNKNGGWDIW